jgi:hypothetical protein
MPSSSLKFASRHIKIKQDQCTTRMNSNGDRAGIPDRKGLSKHIVGSLALVCSFVTSSRKCIPDQNDCRWDSRNISAAATRHNQPVASIRVYYYSLRPSHRFRIISAQLFIVELMWQHNPEYMLLQTLECPGEPGQQLDPCCAGVSCVAFID